MNGIFVLPQEKIAKFPPKERGTTKLMILNRSNGEITHDRYFNLEKYLDPTDLMILNNTKVIPARLRAFKENGKEVELLVLEKHKTTDNKVQYRGKLNEGEIVKVADFKIQIEKILVGGFAIINSENLEEIIEKYGETPIPPYLKREANTEDRDRYQTTFAKNKGSVAAPTASLNLTGKILEKIKEKGIEIKEITLHVGIGTFLPIRTENIEEHKMHSEFYKISKEAAEKIKTQKNSEKKILAVGTTVTRALEHASSILKKDFTNEIEGEADIFIRPGYKFQIVDKLLTNFHAPDSTVIQLAAAFAGEALLKKAYQEALENDYMFLSYGDSMLII